MSLKEYKFATNHIARLLNIHFKSLALRSWLSCLIADASQIEGDVSPPPLDTVYINTAPPVDTVYINTAPPPNYSHPVYNMSLYKLSKAGVGYSIYHWVGNHV